MKIANIKNAQVSPKGQICDSDGNIPKLRQSQFSKCLQHWKKKVVNFDQSHVTTTFYKFHF